MEKEKIDIISKKLSENENKNIDDVNIYEVDNITDIKIDNRKTSIERITEFLLNTKNPYIIKNNNTIIKIEFRNNSKKAKDSVESIFKNIYLNEIQS